MSREDFSLLCSHGGRKTISFHSLYVIIKNELNDTIESTVIPYRSVSFVFEEHLNNAEVGLRKMNIHLICGAIHTIETAEASQAEIILVHLLKNTLVQAK
jgi:hypothetical protein